jgi:hypothetical protein
MISLCRPTLSVLRAHRITFMFSVSISVYNPTGHWMINRSTHVTYPTGTRATIFQIVDSTYSPGTSLMVHYAFNACVATVSIKWGSHCFLFWGVTQFPQTNSPRRIPSSMGVLYLVRIGTSIKPLHSRYDHKRWTRLALSERVQICVARSKDRPLCNTPKRTSENAVEMVR